MTNSALRSAPRKRNSFAKTAICYATSFLLPSFLMFFVLRNFGFYPFGDTSLLHSDMSSQYIHFFEYYRNSILLGEGSVFFSWSKELGTAFIGLFAYYLASPFNVILIFFPNLLVGIFALQVFKVGLCGLSFYILIRSVFREKQVGISGLIFSTSYALMSYAIAFSMCIMWIDGLIFLPLMCLGTVKILENKRPYLFSVAVGLMMISNFYIGFMAALMTVIFVIFFWICQAEEKRVKLRRLLWRFSLFGAVGMSFALWIILPAMAALSHGRVDDGFALFHPGTNFGLYQFEQSFLPGNFTSIMLDGLPHLYVGMTVFACFVGFFITRKIKPREKLAAVGIFIFLLMSFWITTLDYMWHGFVPYFWFRHRQGFVMSFFMIFVAAKFFYAIKDDVYSKIKSFFKKHDYNNLKSVTNTTVVTLTLIALIFAGSDMYFNAFGIKEGINTRHPYRQAHDYLTARERGEEILEIISEHGDGFYRVRFSPGMRGPFFNEPLGFGFNGFGHYSSSYNLSLNDALRDMGFAQGWFWSSTMGATSLTDAIFGVRFVASQTPLHGSHKRIGQVDRFYIYENLNVLPPIILMGERFLDGSRTGINSPFDTHSAMLHNFASCCQTIMRIADFNDLENYRGAVYLSFPHGEFPRGALTINGERIHYFSNANETHHTVFLGENLQNPEILINGTPLQQLNHNYSIAIIDHEVLGVLREQSLQNVEYGATYLRGTLYSSEERYAFASIPFDEGLQIRVNGVRVALERHEGAFLRFPVSAGENEIEVRFVSPGLNLALFGGVLGVLTIGIFLFFDIKKKRTRQD